MLEEWRDVRHYEGIYEVSNLGRVRNNRKQILKQYQEDTGYLSVKLHKEGISIKRYVHRLVAIAFIENPENKPQVNHKYHDKTDNRAESLEWTTVSENRKHMLRDGRSSQQRPITLKLIDSDRKFNFCSHADASRFLNRNIDYISAIIRRKSRRCRDKLGNVYIIINE